MLCCPYYSSKQPDLYEKNLRFYFTKMYLKQNNAMKEYVEQLKEQASYDIRLCFCYIWMTNS